MKRFDTPNWKCLTSNFLWRRFERFFSVRSKTPACNESWLGLGKLLRLEPPSLYEIHIFVNTWKKACTHFLLLAYITMMCFRKHLHCSYFLEIAQCLTLPKYADDITASQKLIIYKILIIELNSRFPEILDGQFQNVFYNCNCFMKLSRDILTNLNGSSTFWSTYDIACFPPSPICL